ncbi:glutamate receptor 3-like [Cherax quadricarinatus]|uniref:glutamate receptor 3-like n=1 Tax=Cherax quadricarinatus TaxID=27406 RepID=UPI002378A579|nr:uncharacterized protein LOC128700835 [Cherax quadricarinatus]
MMTFYNVVVVATVMAIVGVTVLVMGAQVRVQVKGKGVPTRKQPSHTNARLLLRAWSRVLKNRQAVTDPLPLALADVVKDLGGGEGGPCHVLLYYDSTTVPPEDLAVFRSSLSVPITLIDVSKLTFTLITKVRRRVPLLELLSFQADNRCRLLVAWSSSNYQRGLMLMAQAEPVVLGLRGTLVLPVTDNSLDRFIPQLRRRILVKRQTFRKKQGTSEARFLVEGTCEICQRYYSTRLGDWRYPDGWKWGRATPYGHVLPGANLTVVYTPSVPNIFPMKGDGALLLEGIEMRLLEYIAKALRFSYRLVVPSDGEWGRPVNGTWTGKVGEVVTGRADIAMGGLVYTDERAAVVEYSLLFLNEVWGIVCPLPVRLPVWPYIMFPFRTESAPSVFALFVVFNVMAYLVGTVVAIQAPQGPRDPWAESVVRVIHVGVSLYLRLMACLYFWNIYYCLIKPKYEPPVDSSTELLQSGYDWGVVSGTTVPRILTSSQHSVHWDLNLRAKPLPTITEGFQRLRKENLCLVGVPKRFALATIAMRHSTKCGEPGLQVSSEDLNSVLSGWVLPRGSPLTSYINDIILRLQSFGLLEHWKKKMHELLITRAPRDLPCLNPPPSSLTILDLRLTLFILLGGWCLALLVFVGEHLVSVFIKCDIMTVTERSTEMMLGSQTARNNERRDGLSDWLSVLLSPVPSINISVKEAVFRRQLDAILRDNWGLDIR